MTCKSLSSSVREYVREAEIWTARFDSVGELVEFALDSDSFADGANKAYYETWRKTHSSGKRKFWNGYTIDRMRRELRAPSRARLEAVCELEKEIELPPPARPVRRVRVRQPDGEELDPLAWVRRDPDGWISIERTAMRAPRVVQIAVNLSVHWKAEPEELLWRGATIVALADYYTRQGCSVGITGFSAIEGLTKARKFDDYVLEIVVKRPSEPLDLPMLALALSEIAFFRIVVLSAVIRLAPSEVRDCLGAVIMLPSRRARSFDAIADKGVRSKDDALLFIRDLVEKETQR